MPLQTPSGRRILFLPEEHTDFFVVSLPRRKIPWGVVGVVLVTAIGFAWWLQAGRSRDAV